VAAWYSSRYKRALFSWTPDEGRKEAPMVKLMLTRINESFLGASCLSDAVVTSAH
jgi:hypothetical protein